MKQTIDNIPPGVIRRQYAKGMKLWQLAILYDADEASIQPIVEGIVQNLREEEEEENLNEVPRVGAKVERKKSRYYIDHATYADRVKQMMDAGMSNAEMMDKLDITHSNLQTIKKKFGLKLTYAHGGPCREARRKRLAQAKEETT